MKDDTVVNKQLFQTAKPLTHVLFAPVECSPLSEMINNARISHVIWLETEEGVATVVKHLKWCKVMDWIVFICEFL